MDDLGERCTRYYFGDWCSRPREQRDLSVYIWRLIGGALYRAAVLQGGVVYSTEYFHYFDLVSFDVSRFWIGGSNELVFEGLREVYAERGVNLAGSLLSTALLVGGTPLSVLTAILYGMVVGCACAFVGRKIESGTDLQLLVVPYMILWVSAAYQTGFVPLNLLLKICLGLVLLWAFGLKLRLGVGT